MIEYRTHTWPQVVAAFERLASMNDQFAPMADAVARIASSPYATGLYPVQSMHTLRLYQHERYAQTDEELRLDLEDGSFAVRHRAGTTPDPRFTLSEPVGVWEKRGPDAMALLERAFHHLRWFVEYDAPRSLDPDHDPAA